jgi:hypothetical protein
VLDATIARVCRPLTAMVGGGGGAGGISVVTSTLNMALALKLVVGSSARTRTE